MLQLQKCFKTGGDGTMIKKKSTTAPTSTRYSEAIFNLLIQKYKKEIRKLFLLNIFFVY
jgi:hypothetical protein